MAGPGLAGGTGALGQVHPDRCTLTLSLPARSGDCSPGLQFQVRSEVWREMGVGRCFVVSLCVNTRIK